MMKYIFTEAQIKGVIDNIINEGIVTENYGGFLKLSDLAKIVARLGDGTGTDLPYDMLLKIFVDTHRDKGPEGVIKLFKSATKLSLEDFGYGRYQIK